MCPANTYWASVSLSCQSRTAPLNILLVIQIRWNWLIDVVHFHITELLQTMHMPELLSFGIADQKVYHIFISTSVLTRCGKITMNLACYIYISKYSWNQMECHIRSIVLYIYTYIYTYMINCINHIAAYNMFQLSLDGYNSYFLFIYLHYILVQTYLLYPIIMMG